MLIKPTLLLTLIVFGFTGLLAQEKNGERFQKDFQYHLQKTTESIKIDGEFTEAIWTKADTMASFWRKFPTDGGRPQRQTSTNFPQR